jgi:hypothetical protein
MGYWQCLLFGQCAACSAGVASTLFRCEVQHERSDIRLASHVERPSATPGGKAQLAGSELPNHFAKRRGRAVHRKCTGRQYRTTLGRVRTDKPLKAISIYSLRRKSREQMRRLYMNDAAIRIWEDMGRAPNIIGAQSRLPHSALLTLGVPFSG